MRTESADRDVIRKGRHLEYLPLGWNLGEAVVAIVLLIGLGANALLAWWWADPVAGLVMVPIFAKEGVEAPRGETCGCNTTCQH